MAAYTVGQQIPKADLEARWAFPIGANPVDGTVISINRYATHTAIVISVPGSGMAGDTTSMVLR